ncbi:MAG: ATP-binding protein [Parvibaculales bacterium]
MSSPQTSFTTLAALLDEATALLDGKGKVVDANEQMYGLFGRQIFNHPMERFIRGPEFIDAMNTARRDRTVQAMPYNRMEQTQRAYRLRLAPLEDDHLMLVVADDTDKLTVNRVHSDFVANVSHELRSPLTTLTGFIETLLDGAGEDADARTHFLGIMETEAARMQRLIDDLLSLSRVEAEEHRVPDGRVDMRQLLDQVVSLVSRKAEDVGTSLSIELDGIAQDDVTVIGNLDELQQVFLNLVENAIRYGDDNQPVRLVLSHGRLAATGETDTDLLRVQVINKGPQIPDEQIARLTERFYRVDKGRSREMGGTGLGLAIVKHIINKHRGRLRITSDPQATVFSVTLRKVANSQ